MNEKIISQICMECFGKAPEEIERCTVGQGNYVYILNSNGSRYVLRCSVENDAYDGTVCWLEKLLLVGVPVPKVIAHGKCEEYTYLILTYLEGKDIGLVYQELCADDKRAIAKHIVHIQSQVSKLRVENAASDWSWIHFVNYMLERAKKRIFQNGYFDVEKVERIQEQMVELDEYFANVAVIAYLDDISTKNLLIQEGKISGIIDVDWIGIGDKLTFVALTNMALLNLEYDTDYVKYILDEIQITAIERKAFLFYTLMYCVDFMGERGMKFMDRQIEVNEQIIERLDGIYEKLWCEWCAER